MIKLLLVEDDANLCYIIRGGLEDMIGGYEVMTASNGEEGLKIWKEQHLDIIISDIEMPVMDGYEMVRRIRETDGFIPIVFTSGRVSPKDVVKGYEVPDNILDREFSVLRFEGATKEWLEFVVNNRRGKGKNSYDLIMGPVANDQLYATIRLYEQGVVTADAAIEMLKTHKLFNQLSFHTVKVIPLLKFTESIEV